MWVIYNAETGMEIDRVETVKERDAMIIRLNIIDNPFGFNHAYRWED